MKAKKKEVCLLAASAMMGSAFNEEAFRYALEKNPDMIGCDSGTTDSGPYYLGAGKPRMNRKVVKRDLGLMISAGVERGIPVLVGSAGTAGADPNVDWMVGIVREIAKERGLHFRLGEIKTEITPEQLRGYIGAGRFHPLEGAPKFEEKDCGGLTRCTTMMGAEGFVKAMENGAQVVIAGRATDTSIYAAVPMMYGLDNGFAWHAGKVLECGTMSTVFEKYAGCMMAWVRDDSMSLEPAHPEMAASPVSIVSHTLYENADPFYMPEPGCMLITADSVYTAETDRRVRVTGTRLEKRPYSVKVEGVRFEGYRRAALAGVSDPLILKQFDAWLKTCVKTAQDKIRNGMGLSPGDYRMRYLVYGNPKDPNTERVGILFDIIAKNQQDADGIITNFWHTALHVPIHEWEGAQSQTAFPFSPPDLMTHDGGATYSFCLNHVIDLKDPTETCRFRYYDL